MAPSVADIKSTAGETVDKVVDNIAQLKLTNQAPEAEKADPKAGNKTKTKTVRPITVSL